MENIVECLLSNTKNVGSIRSLDELVEDPEFIWIMNYVNNKENSSNFKPFIAKAEMDDEE